MNFASRLKEERERLKIKQNQFAEELEMSVQGIINYEKGARKPSIKYIYALIDKGADIQYIYTGIRSESFLSDEIKELIKLYENAPEAIKLAVRAVLQSGSPSAPIKSVDLRNSKNLTNIKISQ